MRLNLLNSKKINNTIYDNQIILIKLIFRYTIFIEILYLNIIFI